MTKDETARALGISRRTLQRRMSKGEIAYTLSPIPRGEEAIFESAEVERVRAADLAKLNGVTLVPAIVTPLPSRLPARRQAAASLAPSRDSQEVARAIILPAKMAYTLREAAEISGLSITYIHLAVKAGSLASLRLAGVRGRRILASELRAHISELGGERGEGE